MEALGGGETEPRDSGETEPRDSGEIELRDSGETEPRDSGETEPRDSGDSGVGSPSPSGAVRAWGRKAAWRKEARMLAGARAAAQRLAAEHGGEVLLLYRPRSHPNLPSLEPCQVSPLKINSFTMTIII